MKNFLNRTVSVQDTFATSAFAAVLFGTTGILIYVWSYCSTAAASVAGALFGIEIACVIILLMFLGATIPNNNEQKKFLTDHKRIYWGGFRPTTLILYSLAFEFNMVSLEIIAAVGAVSSCANAFLFTNFRLYKESESLGYCALHTIGMAGAGAGALVLTHLMISSLMTTMNIELAKIEMMLVFACGAFIAYTLESVFTLVIEKILDFAMNKDVSSLKAKSIPMHP